MSKYINAGIYVDMQTYDEQHESWDLWHGTIEELLDQWTDQGCPPCFATTDIEEGIMIGAKSALKALRTRVKRRLSVFEDLTDEAAELRKDEMLWFLNLIEDMEDKL